MWVRVYDKEAGKYYKSEVYAIINSGLQRQAAVKNNNWRR